MEGGVCTSHPATSGLSSNPLPILNYINYTGVNVKFPKTSRLLRAGVSKGTSRPCVSLMRGSVAKHCVAAPPSKHPDVVQGGACLESGGACTSLKRMEGDRIGSSVQDPQ